jgi:subtilisin family serine protease
VILALLGTAPAAASDTAQNDVASYVLSLSPAAIDSGVDSSDIAAQYGVNLERDFPALHEFSLLLTSTQAALLTSDPDIAAIIPDSSAYLTDDSAVESSDSDPSAVVAAVDQRAGVERIQADTASLPDGISASDINVAVLDTGVSTKQPALNVVGGYNCVGGDITSYGDANGHGTHVAGIIGARDTGSGPRGVVPGAQIWAVKVFDSDGEATISDFLCGVNWIAQHADTIQVVNFSAIFPRVNTGGCGVTSTGQVIDPVHQAICFLVNDLGIPFVVAAGNGGSMASNVTPATYPESISVGAIVDTDGKAGGLGERTKWGLDDTRARFSNYGPSVTVFAPGADILSTTVYGGYISMSGTSMAAPFVTGAVALYRRVHPDATPAQIKNVLVASGDPGTWAVQPLLDVPRLLATDPSVVPVARPVTDPLAIGSDGLPVR